VTGVDVAADLSLVRGLPRAGEPDPVQLAMDVRAFDRLGTLATFSSGVEATWSKLQTLLTGGSRGDRRWLMDHPLRAALVVPPRRVRELPAFLRKDLPLAGTMSANLALDGTFASPRVHLDATLDDVHGPDKSLHRVDLLATYDGKLAKTHVALAPKERPDGPLFVADAEVALDENALFAPGARIAELPWTAKLDAKLHELPLEMFPAATAAELGGVASGELHVADVHAPNVAAPTAKGSIAIDRLRLGGDRFDRATLDLRADAKSAGMKLVLRGPAGTADVTLDAPLVWQHALVPALAPEGAVTARLATKHLRLKGFEALVSPLDELDGRLDVDVHASIHPNAGPKGASAFATDLGGTIHLDDGTIVVDALGDAWRHVAADVAIEGGKVELKKLHLEGTHGKVDASGSATLNGVVPKNATVELSTDRFPFSIAGVPLGDLSGKVKATADFTDSKVVKIDLNVTPMTIDLAPSSDKHPQELVDDPTIVVYQPLRRPKPVSGTSGGQTAVRIAVHMPQNVWVRRNDLQVAVLGDPTVELAGATRLSGEVRVDRGWAEVLGKRFIIDHAIVRFSGGTELNPHLDIAVKWIAPDASIVTIAIGDYLKTPRVTMTADPPASQAEIMSLLALGRRDAGSASKQQQADNGAAAQTAALVQGFTGAILGKQLQNVLPPEMSLSFQPGDQGFANAKYAAGYQFKNVYFDIGYDAGAQQTGTQPAQSQPRTTFGVEWRFAPTWSLITTLGDTGSAAVDLLWHFRY
jgi:autotransporter translocation and assembly factor TamB